MRLRCQGRRRDFAELFERLSQSTWQRFVGRAHQIGPDGEHARRFVDAGMHIHPERGDLSVRKKPAVDACATRLDCGVGREQACDVQHLHAKCGADEVARLVDGNVVCGRAVAGEDKNPLEAVLRDLRANIGDQRSSGRLSNRICAGMDRKVTEIVGAAVSVVDGRHHHDSPISQCLAHTSRGSVGLVRHAHRIGADRQVSIFWVSIRRLADCYSKRDVEPTVRDSLGSCCTGGTVGNEIERERARGTYPCKLGEHNRTASVSVGLTAARVHAPRRTRTRVRLASNI